MKLKKEHTSLNESFEKVYFILLAFLFILATITLLIVLIFKYHNTHQLKLEFVLYAIFNRYKLFFAALFIKKYLKRQYINSFVKTFLKEKKLSKEDFSKMSGISEYDFCQKRDGIYLNDYAIDKFIKYFDNYELKK